MNENSNIYNQLSDNLKSDESIVLWWKKYDKFIKSHLDNYTFEDDKSKNIIALAKAMWNINDFKSYINYLIQLNNSQLDNQVWNKVISEKFMDDITQLAQIKNNLNELKVDTQNYNSSYWNIHNHPSELNENYPNSINFKIRKGFYYFEWKWPDHTRNMKKVEYSNEFRNGLQKGEIWIILMKDKKNYRFELEVIHQWDILELNLRHWGQSTIRLTEILTLSRRNKWRNVEVTLGNKVRNKKDWEYMRLRLDLDWR